MAPVTLVPGTVRKGYDIGFNDRDQTEAQLRVTYNLLTYP